MKQFSEETRRKMSESAKKRCSRPEWLDSQHSRGTYLPYETVSSMYEQGYTQKEIGEYFCVSQKVVWRFMKNHGIVARKAKKRNQYGSNNDYWKGGVTKDQSGYILVKKDGHPRAKKCGGYVREHILVAEKMLGQNITKEEHVHHINGNKDDNRPENLAVMSAHDHLSYHSKIREMTKRRFGNDTI